MAMFSLSPKNKPFCFSSNIFHLIIVFSLCQKTLIVCKVLRKKRTIALHVKHLIEIQYSHNSPSILQAH